VGAGKQHLRCSFAFDGLPHVGSARKSLANMGLSTKEPLCGSQDKWGLAEDRGANKLL